jgi:uncharacterized protein involved in exopolysaccharide biosynthesis
VNEQALFQDVRRYLAILHKRRGIVATCVVTSLLLALLYNYTTRPIYQATAQILIDRDTPNITSSRARRSWTSYRQGTTTCRPSTSS